jgi:cytoskeletal protein CcmA (bactofilin family)
MPGLSGPPKAVTPPTGPPSVSQGCSGLLSVSNGGQSAGVWGYVGPIAGDPAQTSTPPVTCGVLGQGHAGVHGISTDGNGVVGESTSGWGISGTSTSGPGVVGTGQNYGVYGSSDTGVGVGGSTKDGDAAVSGQSSGSGLAGWFEGGVRIDGALTLNGTANITGAVTIDGNISNTGSITTTGNVSAYDVLLSGGDLAEDFHAADDAQIEPGTVMVIAETGEALSLCASSYDRRVAGVVSGAGDLAPGIVLDNRHDRCGRVTVAMAGKVYCKVDAEYGAIGVGDLLTTSPTPGHAMRASDPTLAFGSVLGKALRPLVSGRGLVPVLVALQ